MKLIFKNLIYKSLILSCFTLSINTVATPKKFDKKVKVNTQVLTEKDKLQLKTTAETIVLQVIKDEFTKNEVIFDIPKIMEPEFDTIKKSIIVDLVQKISTQRAPIDSIGYLTTKKQVSQKFKFFIEKVKLYHISEWTQAIMANVKKNKSQHKNSSAVVVDKSLRELADNPPYLNNKNS